MGFKYSIIYNTLLTTELQMTENMYNQSWAQPQPTTRKSNYSGFGSELPGGELLVYTATL